MKYDLIDPQPVAPQIHEAALALAQAACDLDWNKNAFAPHLRTQAIGMVRDMHKLADALEAESRNISPLPIPLPANGERVPEAGEGENEPAGPGWAAVTGGLS